MQRALGLRGQLTAYTDKPFKERASDGVGKIDRKVGRTGKEAFRNASGKSAGPGCLGDEATDEEVAGEGHATTSCQDDAVGTDEIKNAMSVLDRSQQTHQTRGHHRVSPTHISVRKGEQEALFSVRTLSYRCHTV